MIKPDEDIEYISNYISAYENIIRTKNSAGLTDSARLFEFFALEIANLYFNRDDFRDCNDENPQFPYVDLVSGDNCIFVQVTTEKKLPSKIKRTLNKIKNSKKLFAKSIKEVFFIALDNRSVDEVTSYSGKRKIGNVSFVKSKNLITTRKIIQKAGTDPSFRERLCAFLRRQDGFLEETNRIKQELSDSEEVGLKRIVDTIGGKYRIDLSARLKEINGDKSKNVLVEGRAGTGKSVLCKKICECTKHTFYSLAERFAQETDINNIWNFDLIRALDFLKDKDICFFIDGLERISDTRTNLELLDKFYHWCSKYNNVRIIASCRSTDKAAFESIIGKYDIHSYLTEDVSLSELKKIANTFPSVEAALKNDTYINLI